MKLILFRGYSFTEALGAYLKAKISYKTKNAVGDYRVTACNVTGVGL